MNRPCTSQPCALQAQRRHGGVDAAGDADDDAVADDAGEWLIGTRILARRRRAARVRGHGPRVAGRRGRVQVQRGDACERFATAREEVVDAAQHQRAAQALRLRLEFARVIQCARQDAGWSSSRDGSWPVTSPTNAKRSVGRVARGGCHR